MPTIADCPCPGDLMSVGINSVETLDQWYGPNYRYLKARNTNGDLYILRFDEHQTVWELIVFKSARAQMRKDRV